MQAFFTSEVTVKSIQAPFPTDPVAIITNVDYAELHAANRVNCSSYEFHFPDRSGCAGALTGVRKRAILKLSGSRFLSMGNDASLRISRHARACRSASAQPDSEAIFRSHNFGQDIAILSTLGLNTHNRASFAALMMSAKSLD